MEQNKKQINKFFELNSFGMDIRLDATHASKRYQFCNRHLF